MKPLSVHTRLSPDFKETVAALLIHTRSKVISAADVWNIQRQKKSLVQRRLAL